MRKDLRGTGEPAGVPVCDDARMTDIFSCAAYGCVVLDQDTVHQHRHPGLIQIGPILLEDRSSVDDVVTVPLAGLAHRIDKGRLLLVDRADHAVDIGFIVIGVKYLDLIQPLEENSAVASALALALDPHRSHPFQMELATAELSLGADVSGASLDNCHHSIVNTPEGRRAIFSHPHGKVFPVKKHNGVGRCRTGSARIDHCRLRIPELGHGRSHLRGFRMVLLRRLGICCR